MVETLKYLLKNINTTNNMYTYFEVCLKTYRPCIFVQYSEVVFENATGAFCLLLKEDIFHLS